MSDNISQIAGFKSWLSIPGKRGRTRARQERHGHRGGFKMSMEPEGWYMNAGPPSWDAEARTFSFFLRKSGRETVMCILATDALENTAQSSDLPEPALSRIFDAHRLMIELRAAQKLNAGLLDADVQRWSDGVQPCSGT